MWGLDPEFVARQLGYYDFNSFLQSDLAKKYVELVKVEGDKFYYGTKCTKENEHVLHRIRDDHLSEERRYAFFTEIRSNFC